MNHNGMSHPQLKLCFVVTEACNLLAQLFVYIYPYMLISASENKFLVFRHAIRILLQDGKACPECAALEAVYIQLYSSFVHKYTSLFS
jgi:hypothetical protein